jgi:hypothetical protein
MQPIRALSACCMMRDKRVASATIIDYAFRHYQPLIDLSSISRRFCRLRCSATMSAISIARLIIFTILHVFIDTSMITPQRQRRYAHGAICCGASLPMRARTIGRCRFLAASQRHAAAATGFAPADADIVFSTLY